MKTKLMTAFIAALTVGVLSRIPQTRGLLLGA